MGKLRIDNAAQIYTAGATKKLNSVFRVGAQMKVPVDPYTLRQAVRDLTPRFPSLYVHLHKGAFNDYLVSMEDCDNLNFESEYPCRSVDLKDKTKPLFRVLYNKKKIDVEFFHGLTDGSGAMAYLKTLIARYLEILGNKIEFDSGVLKYNTTPTAAETEDSFYKIYDKKKSSSRSEPNAYQYLPEKKENFFKLTQGYVDVASLKKVVKEKHNCTITEYFVALYCYSFLHEYLKDEKAVKSKKPIRISVPANMRSIFPSETLRNFSMFTNVDIFPHKKNYAFIDVLAEIKTKMKAGLDKEELHKVACQNVHDAKMPIAKFAPNALRRIVLKQCFLLFGEKKNTSTMTNLGLQKVPESMKPFIERFEFVVGPLFLNRIACGIISIGNEMTVTFSSVSEKTDIQDFFFNTLKAEGVKLTVASDNEKKENGFAISSTDEELEASKSIHVA